MKKQYSKPGIIVENFSISQNIATGCGAAHDSIWGSPNHWTKETCGWKNQWNQVLWYEKTICDNIIAKPDPDNGIPEGDVGGICYNNPVNGMTIFSS